MKEKDERKFAFHEKSEVGFSSKWLGIMLIRNRQGRKSHNDINTETSHQSLAGEGKTVSTIGTLKERKEGRFL